MEQKEREKFYRYSTVIVDHGKYAFDSLLEDDLSKNKTNLVDFINANQHEIYHLCYNRQLCCQCRNSILPTTTPASRVLHPDQLQILLDRNGQKFPTHRTGNGPPCCCSPANPNMAISDLDLTLIRCLLTNFCNIHNHSSIRQSIKDLVKYRNSLYAHATEARIPDSDYGRCKKDIEGTLMTIARYCNKENEMTQKIRDAETRPLDQNTCMQYQINLLSEIQRNTNIEKEIKDLQMQVNDGEERILARLQTLEDQEGEIGKRRQSFIEHTKDRLATVEENMHILTKAQIKFMTAFEQNNVLTVLSKKGGGKTLFCLQNAYWLQKIRGYTPLIFVKDEVVRNRELINIREKYIYILEDFFGRETPQFNEDVHSNLLDMLNDCFKQPSCESKLILTLRTGQPYCNSILDKHTIFEDESVVDLDNLSTYEDRQKIFHYHLLQRGISICSSAFAAGLYNMLATCFSNCSGIDVKENDDKSFTICRAAFVKICQSEEDNDVGFPQTCYLFCCESNFLKQGRDYFKNTSKSLVNEIKRLHASAYDRALLRYQYVVLVYVALNGCVDVEDIDHNFMLNILAEFQEKSIRKSLMTRAAETMEGKYLSRTPKLKAIVDIDLKRRKTESSSQYFMQHSTITDAVLLTYGRENDLLSICDADFFFRYYRPKRYHDPKNTLPVLFSDNELIAKYLLYKFTEKNQSLRIGNYLNMVTLRCRNDKLLKLFFEGVDVDGAKPSLKGLVDGLTNYGKMVDIVTLHPNICKKYLLYGSSETIYMLCRPHGWGSERSDVFEFDGFKLVVRLFCVLLGFNLKEFTFESAHDGISQCTPNKGDYYETPTTQMHVGKINIEEQKRIGNFVYEKLIVHRFKSLVRLFLFLIILKPNYVNPIIVWAFLDGLTDFGERKCVVEEYRSYWEVLVFKFGSIPTILKLCRPVSDMEEDNLLLKVDDEKLSRKLCGIYHEGKLFHRHVTNYFDSPLNLNNSSYVMALSMDYGSYYICLPLDYRKLYLHEIADYIYENGIKASNATFVYMIYNELVDGAVNAKELTWVIRRYLFESRQSAEEGSYLLQFVSTIIYGNHCPSRLKLSGEFKHLFSNLLNRITDIELNSDDESDIEDDSDDTYNSNDDSD